MKKWIWIIGSVVLVAVLVCVFLFCQAPIRYQLAEGKMSRGDYAAAAKGFEELNGYRDAQVLSLYADALAHGENGEYELGHSELEKVKLLLPEGSELTADIRICSDYYLALGYEQKQDYEEAALVLVNIPEYRDVPDRLASYPALILERDYAIALQYEENGNLALALRMYENLGDYLDSKERAEKMRTAIAEAEQAEKQARYDQADALEQEGKLEEALVLFDGLDDFSDAAARVTALQEKIVTANKQARYDQADALEQEGKWEDALVLFDELDDFSDAAARVTALQDKIVTANKQARYDQADALEQEGKWEDALVLFDELDDFSDAAARVTALQEKIVTAEKQARYDQADALEKEGRMEEALVLFDGLDGFSDSAERAAAIREAIRLAEEQARQDAYAAAVELKEQGHYIAARKAFLELGNYSDSQTLAAELKNPALYEEALSDIHDGKYTKAYGILTGLGDYENSARLAYLSRIGQFSTKTEALSDHTAVYQFHDLWGFVNFDTMQMTEPSWKEYKVQADGTVVVSSGELSGLLSAEGTEVFAPSWTDYLYLDDSEMVIVDHKGIKLIRTDGTVVLESAWSHFSQITGSLAIVREEARPQNYALLNYRTLEQTEFIYSGISADYANGLFTVSVEKDGKTLYGLLSTRMNEILPCEYTVLGTQTEGAPEAPVFDKGLLKVQTAEGKWGFADAAGIRIPAEFDEISMPVNGFAVYRVGKTYGFIKEDNSFRIDPLYDEVQNFNTDGYAEVKDENGRWQILDTDGCLLYFMNDEYSLASEKEKAEGREAALDVYLAAGSKADSHRRIQSVYYRQAEAARTAGNYEEAVRLYKLAAGYADSDDLIRQTEYDWAIALRDAGQWDEAETKFKKLGDFPDAKTQITETRYQHARTLDAAGEYREAYEIYKDLTDYKDVKTILKTEQYRKFIIKVNDIITFGTYPQTAAGNDATPIEWIVLDVQDDKALVISRNALDCKPYNASRTNVTWETCSLRKWLNNEFIAKAFNEQQQTAILVTNVDNSKNQGNTNWNTSGGNNTQDKVFLLSCTEAKRYFKDNDARKCAPIDYAIGQGAYTGTSKVNGRAAGRWWLRSPGLSQNYAALVDTVGSLYYYYVDRADVAVRPALWINLDSDLF